MHALRRMDQEQRYSDAEGALGQEKSGVGKSLDKFIVDGMPESGAN